MVLPLIPLIIGGLTLASTGASVYQGMKEAELNETIQNANAAADTKQSKYKTILLIAGAAVAAYIIWEVIS